MRSDPRTVSFSLMMLRFSTRPEDIDEGCCPDCGLYLELHQPDAGSPQRLIGVCERCGNWYLIDILSEDDEAVMVLLPPVGSFRDAIPTNGRLR